MQIKFEIPDYQIKELVKGFFEDHENGTSKSVSAYEWLQNNLPDYICNLVGANLENDLTDLLEVYDSEVNQDD